MRERAHLGVIAAVLFLLFAACQSQPAPTTADAAEQVALLSQRVESLEFAQRSLLQQLIPLSGNHGIAEPSATALEQNALLARIADGLEGLRDATTTGAGKRPADAAGRRQPIADEAAILAMQRALQAAEQQRNTLLENIANVNTPGYRRRSLRLSTELQAGTGLELPVARGIVTKDSTGTLEITERTLDVAIDGRGLFGVRLPGGELAYTRAGGFLVTADGTLCHASGAVLQPTIVVPSDTLELSIDPEGRVTVRTAGNADQCTPLGQLVLHDVRDADELEPRGDCLLQPRDGTVRPRSATPGQNGLGLLKQGFLERSNVQLLDELVELSIANRQLLVLRRQLAQFGVFAW